MKRCLKMIACLVLMALLCTMDWTVLAATEDELELSAFSNRLTSEPDEDGFTHFTAKTKKGRSIEFLGYHVYPDNDAFLYMEPDGWLLQLDATHGIYGLKINSADALSGKDYVCNAEGAYVSEGTERLDENDIPRMTSLNEVNINNDFLVGDGAGVSFLYISTEPGYNGDLPVRIDKIRFKYTGTRTSVKRLWYSDEGWNGERLFYDGMFFDEKKMTGMDIDQYPFIGLQVYAELSNGNTCWEYSGFTVGDLRDENGNVVDKSTARLHEGYTMEVSADGHSCVIPFTNFIKESGFRPKNNAELSEGAYPAAEGDWLALVIPVAFRDDSEKTKNATLELIRQAVGSVDDGNGHIKKYKNSADSFMSLSEYFSNASLGKFNVTGFISDWYTADMTGDEAYDMFVDDTFVMDAVRKVQKDNPGIDWSRFDSDGDGCLDAVCLINTLTHDEKQYYSMQAFSGAYGYLGWAGSSTDGSLLDNYITLCRGFFDEKTEQGGKRRSNNTLIHEFSHLLGIMDYYDYTYSGYEPLGGFDMQDRTRGDWNCFSKYSVGWNSPTIITEEAVQKNGGMFTIYSSAITDSCLAIPARGSDIDSPFSEYIMVDLFTPEGNNRMDAREYNMQNTDGVRIYHVDARITSFREETVNGVTVHHYDTFYSNSYNDQGLFEIEICPRNRIGDENFVAFEVEDDTRVYRNTLYRVNDHFGREAQDTFFCRGVFDNGEEFGWCITVAEIGRDRRNGAYAVICVTPIEDTEPQFEVKGDDLITQILPYAVYAIAVLLIISVILLLARNRKKRKKQHNA